jgi:acetyl-CoA C-acetyltransferase
VEVGGRRPVTVTEDEHPKPGTTVEMLAELRPAFARNGTVTAGNASGINDGGAILALRVARDMARRDLELGIVTLCIGGGQALAALFRRV